MTYSGIGIRIGLACVLITSSAVSPLYAEPGKESQRLERAKDLIGDEQWARAIEELKAAAADRKENNKDEALFWLAHSQNQTRDSGSALETINRLEREYPTSRWVKPARSLRVEIAERMRRSDVLWFMAVPRPPRPVPATPAATPPPVSPAPPMPAPAAVPPTTPPPTPRPAPRSKPVPPAAAPVAMPAMPPDPPMPPFPPAVWMPEHFFPDTDLQILALGSLIRTDAPKAIPILKTIVESGNAAEARRALMVLGQCGCPAARLTIVEVAKTGSEPVRLAAVRELGRVSGPAVSNELLQVYFTGNARVKHQVVSSLGQRDATKALLQIAQSETDRPLRDSAIVTLGEAGGLDELRTLYPKVAADAKRPIIVGLFNAQAVEALINIAERERDPAIRQEVRTRLRLIGTPRALAYLDGLKQK